MHVKRIYNMICYARKYARVSKEVPGLKSKIPGLVTLKTKKV